MNVNIVKSIQHITIVKDIVYTSFPCMSDESFSDYAATNYRNLCLFLKLDNLPVESKSDIIHIMSSKEYELLFDDDPAPAMLQLENNANI